MKDKFTHVYISIARGLIESALFGIEVLRESCLREDILRACSLNDFYTIRAYDQDHSNRLCGGVLSPGARSKFLSLARSVFLSLYSLVPVSQ